MVFPFDEPMQHYLGIGRAVGKGYCTVAVVEHSIVVVAVADFVLHVAMYLSLYLLGHHGLCLLVLTFGQLYTALHNGQGPHIFCRGCWRSGVSSLVRRFD
jgi:hypothetical protein